MENRELTDIMEAASRYTALLRAGEAFAGLCPYADHADRVGMFVVSPKTGYYWCRGCGRGGNASKLVADLEGEGVMATRGGATQRALPGEASRSTRKTLAYAERYYARQLAESNGTGARRAREYLAGRGINTETLTTFGVGYAPSRRRGRGFSGMAKRLGVERADLDTAGLLNTKGGDRFGERITFPITDSCGRTVGFGARVLPGAPTSYTNRERKKVPIAKYINSRDSETFRKGALLYGLNQALPAIQEERAAIVVEGYTDVLMLHQSGIENAVATLGTALTNTHLRQLSPFADTLYLLFDPDTAGGDAVARAYRVAWTEAPLGASLDTRVVRLEEDPADWLLHHDAGEFGEALATATPALLRMIEGRAVARHKGEEQEEREPVRKAWRRLGAFTHTRLYPTVGSSPSA